MKDRTTGLELTPDEASALFSALDGPIYLASRVVKPLLLRLEQASTDGAATYDYPTITVEHVCPQTIAASSEWEGWFPQQEQHGELVHKIGNLVLLTHRKNASASNYDFNEKKTTYFASGNTSSFTLTAEVREATSWTPDDIEKRQKVVLKRFAKAWRLSDEFESWNNKVET